jgi:DNA-binding NtrC family response regulator
MQKQARILVVDDDPYDNERYSRVLQSIGYEVLSAFDAEQAVALIQNQSFDVVLLDMLLPIRLDGRLDFGGVLLARQIRSRRHSTQVIAVTGYGSRELAAEAMTAGAMDYITKDLDTEDRLPNVVRVAVHRAQRLHLQQADATLQEDNEAIEIPGQLIANSDIMKQLLRRVQRFASIDGPILIEGEPGVGKELIARVLHVNSGYATGPFRVASCRSFSASLIELWGDAAQPGSGLCEQVAGGTLVLKAIDRLPFRQQKSLTDLLDSKRYRPIGATDTRLCDCDFRMIATTTGDLSTMVKHGFFRADFYEILNVATLLVPPLRERREDDIMAIAGHILNHFGLASGIAPAAAALLGGYDYPQENIRELEEILRTAALQAGGGVIQPEHLPEIMLNKNGPANTQTASTLPNERNRRIAELSELIAVKRRRHHRLRVQAATYGVQTDPAITNEAEQLEQEIQALEGELRTFDP